MSEIGALEVLATGAVAGGGVVVVDLIFHFSTERYNLTSMANTLGYSTFRRVRDGGTPEGEQLPLSDNLSPVRVLAYSAPVNALDHAVSSVEYLAYLGVRGVRNGYNAIRSIVSRS